MKVAFINCTSNRGSTGAIVRLINDKLIEEKHDTLVLHSLKDQRYENAVRFSNTLLIKLNSLVSHFFGNYGFEDCFSTKKMIRSLRRFKPDVVHINVIHSHDVNFRMLFRFLDKNPDIKIVWTFHDCWAFTGYCTHFDTIRCDKWKTICYSCPLKRKYSFFFDRSRINFLKKRNSVKNKEMTIVAPSNWIKSKIDDSFYSSKNVVVIQNGINQDVFKPMYSTIRNEYGLTDKIIILAVAYNFTKEKGIYDVVKLANTLEDKFSIILIGSVSSNIELPKKIIHIERIENQKALAEFYSAADIFINPTYEDTSSKTNMESLSCGTPVISYDTGGAAEVIDESTGIKINKGDVNSLGLAISKFDFAKFNKSNCLERAKSFNIDNCVKKYIDLYLDLNK